MTIRKVGIYFQIKNKLETFVLILCLNQLTKGCVMFCEYTPDNQQRCKTSAIVNNQLRENETKRRYLVCPSDKEVMPGDQVRV